MLTFTLAISHLTTSNLPWFIDVIFQVPMQYCSLQHWTLLPSPVPFTTECCFCFGSIPSFFLELFQYSCLENPMNSMKRQKDGTLKEELPRLVVAHMLLEISGEITPERMKGWSQSKNNNQLWMWLVIEARSNAVKSLGFKVIHAERIFFFSFRDAEHLFVNPLGAHRSTCLCPHTHTQNVDPF